MSLLTPQARELESKKAELQDQAEGLLAVVGRARKELAEAKRLQMAAQLYSSERQPSSERQLYSSEYSSPAATERPEHKEALRLRASAASLGAMALGASLGAISSNDEREHMIMLSRGRAGSTVVAQTLASLALAAATTVGPSPEAFVRDFGRDIFGDNLEAMKKVSNPVKLMGDWYQKQAAEQPASPLLGFKWKPELVNAALNGALDWVASRNVSVLWMTRNLLDVRLSVAKHKAFEHEGARVTLAQISYKDGSYPHDNTESLVDALTKDKHFYETELEAMLIAKGVRYKHVRFEDLFDATSASDERGFFVKLQENSQAAFGEWNRIFDFLSLPKVDTYEEIVARANAQMESSTPPTQCDSMVDADKVREALKGSEFEGLLGKC